LSYFSENKKNEEAGSPVPAGTGPGKIWIPGAAGASQAPVTEKAAEAVEAAEAEEAAKEEPP